MSESRVTLRPARSADSRRVWEWRNDGDARRASFDGKPIPLASHERWFANRLARSETRMFIGQDPAGEDVGIVRFDRSGDDALISIVVAPARRREGLGPELLRTACRTFVAEEDVGRVVALVRKDNPGSLAAFRRASFVQDAEIVVDGVDAVRMLLDREQCL